MKQKLIVGWLALAGVSSALGAPAQFYVNDGVVSSITNAPVIDAINFVNNNVFDVFTTAPYHPFDTINFTNKGIMTGNPGFDLQTYPASVGQAGMASNFVNLVNGQNGGIIDCSGAFAFTTVILRGGGLFGSSRFTVRADNIVNSGTINMGASSLLSLSGKSVDLTRGALLMTNLDTFGFATAGILDGYWGIGIGTNPVSTANFDSTNFAFNFPHVVTNRNGTTAYISWGENPPTVYVEDATIGSNRTVRAIYFADTNSLNTNVSTRPFTNTAYFTPFELAVQWQWITTNLLTHLPQTNFMYVTDDFQERTNLQVFVNGTTRTRNTFLPVNYRFFTGSPFGGIPAAPGLPNGTFDDSIRFTNQYAAYEALFSPLTQLPEDVVGGNITNIAGRIEVSASGTLNLSRARIAPLNYLLLKCTNHFAGAPNAQISFPTADFNLATTNGSLTVTNLSVPFLNRPEGFVDMWSARWTNIDANNITNNYHIWFVGSALAPTTPTREINVALRATNIVIADVMNVTSNLLLNAQSVTVITNGPDSLNAVGELHLLNSDILWATATPVLKYLTNSGKITTLNAVFFGGQRGSPFYNSNFNEPYLEFINHGVITNNGSLIWATDFENSGTSTNTGIFFADVAGSIQLQQAQTARLLNGAFYAPLADISIGAGSLLVSNHVLQAGGILTLNVTNLIDDGSLASHFGSSSNGNFWSAGNGINLPNRPAQGSLLSTFVTNAAPDFAEVRNQWSAADYGCSSSGFSSSAGNAPLGGMILDGGYDSLLNFVGAGPGANAIYVDYLEFKDYSTNRDSAGNFIGVGIAPNMTIYFANAVANGVSIAEKLNGKFGFDGASGGHFCWVSGYAGAFSSVTRTNLNDGTPYQVNAALATDCNLDTDGDGIANCVDPDPLHPPPAFAAAQLALAVAMTNSPMRAAVVSWNTTASSTNFVYYKSMASTNWLLLTNFISGPAGSRINVLDPVSSAGRLYRVRVDAPH